MSKKTGESKYKRNLISAINNDLIISPIVNDSFIKADKDGNGYISKEELKNCLHEIAMGLGVPSTQYGDIDTEFAALDINDDKKLSKKEFAKIVKRTLTKLADDL